MIEMTDKENFSGCTLLESLMPKLLRTIIFVILRFFFFQNSIVHAYTDFDIEMIRDSCGFRALHVLP